MMIINIIPGARARAASPIKCVHTHEQMIPASERERARAFRAFCVNKFAASDAVLAVRGTPYLVAVLCHLRITILITCSSIRIVEALLPWPAI